MLKMASVDTYGCRATRRISYAAAGSLRMSNKTTLNGNEMMLN